MPSQCLSSSCMKELLLTSCLIPSSLREDVQESFLDPRPSYWPFLSALLLLRSSLVAHLFPGSCALLQNMFLQWHNKFFNRKFYWYKFIMKFPSSYSNLPILTPHLLLHQSSVVPASTIKAETGMPSSTPLFSTPHIWPSNLVKCNFNISLKSELFFVSMVTTLFQDPFFQLD